MAIRRSISGDVDPAGEQKDRAEQAWIEALAAYFDAERQRIKEALGPKIPADRKAVALQPSFWDDEMELLLSILLPLLSGATLESVGLAAAAAEAAGIAIDWTLVNAAAGKWARQYAEKLIAELTQTTMEGIGETIATWLETPGATMGELFSQLDSAYALGEKRAQAIGVTEVTRAYTEGNLVAGREIEALGFFIYRKTWQTNNDELVCELCEPMHHVSVDGIDTPFELPNGDEVQGPPAHPRDRCWVTFEPVVKD